MTIPSKPWFVYILRCCDNTLYTGITINLSKRLHEHNHTALGAKYTRARRPVDLVYSEEHPSRSAAASREYTIKRLKKNAKEELVVVKQL